MLQESLIVVTQKGKIMKRKCKLNLEFFERIWISQSAKGWKTIQLGSVKNYKNIY